MSTVVSAEGHAENQKRLTELLPLAAEQLRDAWNNNERLKGWTGVRCASVNRMPKAGALDESQFPGLHLLTAMGSRGLTLSLLCAEVLACQLDGRPAPVSDKLVQAMRCSKQALL
jgi:tRNA 5-methylaminomethyl-2-thiouridine biosynthesis bifunctional protein